MSMADKSNKVSVLILGGCGFIGRNLVTWLLEHDCVTRIRVVDKCLPAVAWLNQKHSQAFSHPLVEYKCANLINPASCAKAFADGFDLVIHLAAETRAGQSNEVYKEGIYDLAMNCARQAAKTKAEKFIFFSSGFVYASSKKACTEDSKKEPWMSGANYYLKVEEELLNVTGLNYCVLRPGIVYGLGDRTGLMPRMVVASVYKYLNEKMTLLWNKDLYLNTVHVEDLCSVTWRVFTHSKSAGQVYNVTDSSYTTQGDICKLAAEIFNIKYEFLGNFSTKIATLAQDLEELTEDINDKHLSAWAEVCGKDGVTNTPLTPFIKPELLRNKSLHLDSSKLFTSMSFTPTVTRPNRQKVQEILQDYAEMKLFPRSLLNQELLT